MLLETVSARWRYLAFVGDGFVVFAIESSIKEQCSIFCREMSQAALPSFIIISSFIVLVGTSFGNEVGFNI